MMAVIEVLWTPVSIALIAAMLVGGFLALRGLRGRRIGTDPHCRRCEYNLTGLTSDNCPECGTAAEGRNVVQGRRVRRWGLFAPGAVVMLLAGAILGLSLYGSAKRINWYEYAPDFIVITAAKRDDTAALREVWTRYGEGDLSDQQVSELVSIALEHQDGDSWRRDWMRLLTLMDSTGALTREQQEQFYDKSVRLEIKFRGRIRQGEELQFHRGYQILGVSTARGKVRIVDGEIDVGGHVFEVSWTGARDLDTWLGTLMWGPSPSEEIAMLEPGIHPVVVTATKEFLCWGDTDWDEPSFTSEVRLTGQLEMVSADAPELVELVDDPSMRKQFQDAIRFALETWPRGGPPSDTEIALTSWVHGELPMDAAFDVFLLIGDREVSAGTRDWRRDAEDTPLMSRPIPKPAEGETVTPILRASIDAAKQARDIYKIWDGEIRFDPLTWTEPETEEP